VADDVVAVGRINIDMIMDVDTLPSKNDHITAKHAHISFGGSAANFASQSARLGVKTGLLACVGNDLYGQLALKQLVKMGINTDQTLVLDKQSTGLYLHVRTPSEGRIIISDPGANRFLEKRVIEEAMLARSRTVHIAGGFPALTKQIAEVTSTNGMILSFDPGRAADNLDFDSILPKVDLLFVNRRELKKYFGLNPSKRALKNFAKTFPGILIIKRGKKPAIATDGIEYNTSQVFEVPVVDTVGSGDAFAAGFITAWTRHEQIEKALHMANAVAALTISKRGSQEGQPTFEQTVRFLKDYGISINEIIKTFKPRGRRKRPRSK
jgi:ribokinase